MPRILLSDTAKSELLALSQDNGRKGIHKQVSKVLRLLQANLRHPSLKTHKFNGYNNPFDSGSPVFEAYAQNRTPGAYRIFWCYGPQQDEVTIIAITPHP